MSASVAASLFLMVLVVLMMVLVMLEGLAEIHLHGIILLPCSPVHHDIVGLVPVGLVEHAELLRRRPPRRSRRRRCVGIVERYSATNGGRSHSVGEVSYVLCVLWVKGLAGPSLVDRVLGHLRESQCGIMRVPGAAAGTERESPGTIWREKASRRR